MPASSHATLQAITEAAAEAAAASYAWLLASEGDGLAVVTATGPDVGATVGRAIPAGQGTAGYVLSSGQPLAVQLHPEDTGPWAAEHALLGRPPETILSVPCPGAAGVHGVLELLDKTQGPFSFDDVEVVSLLGTIAGAALGDGGVLRGPPVVSPDELGSELRQLFADDPPAYARIAAVLQALLANG